MIRERCPYCNKYLEVESYGCDDSDEVYEWECGHCSKTFVFTIEWKKEIEVQPADCLNGSPHDWKQTTTFPVACTRMRCSMCGEERRPEGKEWLKIYFSKGRPKE